MMQTAPAVRSADTRSDGPQAAAVLLATIGASPLGEWLLRPVAEPAHGVPLAEDKQLRLLSRLLSIEVGYYRTFGGLLLTGDPVDGVAAWAMADAVLSAQELCMSAASREDRLRRISPEVGSRLLAIDAASREHRPGDPHLHLAYLVAVDDEEPVRSALLTTFGGYADKAGVVACTDVAAEDVAAWYASHGWTVGEPYDVDTSDGGPRLWPLSRSPRPGAA